MGMCKCMCMGLLAYAAALAGLQNFFFFKGAMMHTAVHVHVTQ
jgi:hypothetical protein